jgi:hypothetical protein
MNDQLEKALVQIIEKASAGVEAGINFLSAEIPDVIYQLLTWKLVEASFYIVINLIVMAALIFLTVKFSGRGSKINPDKGDYDNHAITLTHDEDGDLHPGIVGVVLVDVIAAVITLINVLTYSLVAAQIYVAPKIFLIEYATKLAK